MTETTQVAGKMRAVAALVVAADGALTDGRPTLDGQVSARVARPDRTGLELARAAGWPVLVVGGDESAGLANWCAAAGVECVAPCADPLAAVGAFAQQHGLQADQVAYLGADLGDLPAMAACGLSAAPADGALWVRREAALVLALPGGAGAERVLECRDLVAPAVQAWFSAGGRAGGEWLPTWAESVSGQGAKIGFRR